MQNMVHWQSYIEANPEIMYGKPVIKGTRIPVDLLLEKMAEGETVKDLLEAYPNLTNTAIQAVLAFAADSVKNETIYSFAS